MGNKKKLGVSTFYHTYLNFYTNKFIFFNLLN